MKKLLCSVVFVGVIAGSAMAMEHDPDGYQQGDKFRLRTGEYVEFIQRRRRPEPDVRGVEYIDMLGWVRFLNTNGGNNTGNGMTNIQSSITDTLSDMAVSRLLAVLGALSTLRQDDPDAFSTGPRQGFVCLEIAVSSLLKNGLSDLIKDGPTILISGFLANTQIRQSRRTLIQGGVEALLEEVFPVDPSEDSGRSSIESFVKDFGLAGLYVSKKRVSDLLHGAGRAWDQAVGYNRPNTTTGNTTTTTSENSGTPDWMQNLFGGNATTNNTNNQQTTTGDDQPQQNAQQRMLVAKILREHGVNVSDNGQLNAVTDELVKTWQDWIGNNAYVGDFDYFMRSRQFASAHSAYKLAVGPNKEPEDVGAFIRRVYLR